MSSALALRPASVAVLDHAREVAAALVDVVDLRFDGAQAEIQAGEILRVIETASRDLERERKAEKAPHLEAGREIDRRFAEAGDPLARVAGVIRARLAEAARAREEARRLAVATASRAALAGDLATANEAIVLAADPVFAPVVAEGLSEVYAWEAVAFDVATMPPEYLVPDMTKIRAVLRATPAGVVPKISGVTIERKITHVVRSVR
jgi:hypothetical protein